MKRLSILSALLLAVAGLVGAQDFNLSRQSVFTIVDVADLPASDETGRPYLVQDSSDGTCTSGGGAIKVTCIWDGAWSVYSPSGAVDSVNSQTGAVVLDPDDLDDAATTHKFVTAAHLAILGNTSGTNTGDQTLRYQVVDDEDTPLTVRGTLNFEGAGVTCADDTDQTTCTISGGGASALDDLTDVDTTGAATDDALCYDGAEWVPCEVLVLGNTVELTNTTIDGGAPRTGVTTLPSGANEMPILRHEDDCTDLTGVLDGVACFEEDSNIVYVCESPEGIAGVCDAAGEWTATGGGSLSADSVGTSELDDDANTAVAGSFVVVETGAASFDYIAPNAGTNIANDLEEEGQINATAVTGNAADDQVLLGSGASAMAYATIPDCDNATTSKLLYDQATNTFSCGTDQTGGGGSSTQYAIYPLASNEATGSTTGAGVAVNSTGGCAITHDAGINAYIDCGSTADESWAFEWMIPPNWDGTNLDIHLTNLWSDGGNGTVIILSVAISCQEPDGSETMPSPNSPDSLNFTSPTTPNGKQTTLELTAPTLTGCNAGDKLRMNWTRDGDNASDTFTNITRFTHLMLEWGTS